MLATLYKRPTEAEQQARRANAPAIRVFTEQLHRDLPGPPTDDRLAQTNHFTDVIYLAICAIAKALAGSTLRVMKRRPEPVFQSKKAKRLEKSRRVLGIRKAAGPLPGSEHHDDDLVEAPRSDRFVKLFNHVNENDTLGDLFTGWVTQRRLTGSAVLWCRPSQLGYVAPPAEFYVIPTALVFPLYGPWGSGVLDENSAYPFGAWRVTSYYPSGLYAGMSSAIGTLIDGREVKRHRMYHPLYRWDGYSALTAAGVEFDVVQSIAQSWKSAMDHGFRPDGIVTIKGATEETLDLISAKFQQAHGGSRNANRLVATNGDGVSFDKFFTEPRQMDYDKAWDQMLKFALAVLGVPPGVAGIAEATSYAQLYASLKQFYTLTLAPEAREIGQFLTKHVVYPYEPDTVIQISVPEIDDKDFDLKKQDFLAKYSLQTVDEARGWAGKEPLEPGKGGDELIGNGGGMGLNDPNTTPQPGGVPDGISPGQSANDVLRGKLGLSGAGGDVKRPGNAAGAGSLPGKLSKSRLQELVTSLR